MPAFLQMTMSNPAAIAEVGTALASAAQGFTTTGQGFRQGMATALTTWQGQTKDRAEAVTGRFVDGAGGMASTVREASTAAEGGGGALQELVLQLRAGVMEAQSVGFVVLPVGQVFPGPAHYAEASAAGPGAPAVLEAYIAVARVWTTYFQSLVDVATVQDQVTARAIQGIVLQLDSQLPFRSSIRAPRWFGGRSVLENNQLRGALANELNGIDTIAGGRREIATELPIHRAPGDPYHMRVDRLHLDMNGDLVADEVKSGAASPSPNQRDILPRLPYGGPEVGGDGAAPYLRQGDVVRPGQMSVRVDRWDVDSMPQSARDAIYRNNHSVQDILNGRAGNQARDELTGWMNNPAVRHRRIL
jgi:hypothetical protein